MTKSPRFLPRRILFFAPPNAQLLDIVGPMEVFDAANRVLANGGKPPFYALSIAAAETALVTVSGLKVAATRIDRVRQSPHTLVIGGNFDSTHTLPARAALRQIQRLAKNAERVVSVCSGVFVLGALGLLDGKRCTTHWLFLDTLRARFAKARVETDALYTSDGRIFTSAGVTSGIDLALHLTERDLGAKLALAVARLLVVFLHRPGGQSQFSAALRLHSGASERLRQVARAVASTPAKDHRVDSLAKSAAMSPRHFARVFHQETGATPAAYVESVRLEAARQALEQSDRTVEDIAQASGFGSDETMRRVFQRTLGVSPADYRRRFHR